MRVLAVAALFLSLTSCASMQGKSRQDAVAKISPGLTPTEVAFLIGFPEYIGKAFNDDVFVYKDVRVVFRGGKVSHVFDASTSYAWIKINSLKSGGNVPKRVSVVSGDKDISEDD